MLLIIIAAPCPCSLARCRYWGDLTTRAPIASGDPLAVGVLRELLRLEGEQVLQQVLDTVFSTQGGMVVPGGEECVWRRVIKAPRSCNTTAIGSARFSQMFERGPNSSQGRVTAATNSLNGQQSVNAVRLGSTNLPSSNFLPPTEDTSEVEQDKEQDDGEEQDVAVTQALMRAASGEEWVNGGWRGGGVLVRRRACTLRGYCKYSVKGG